MWKGIHPFDGEEHQLIRHSLTWWEGTLA
jgi:hypothetical protein